MRVQARARRDEIAGVRGDVLIVRVAAPPVEGRANTAVCNLLAKRLGVAPGSVAVVRGAGSRDKVLEIDGFDEDRLRRALKADI